MNYFFLIYLSRKIKTDETFFIPIHEKKKKKEEEK